MNRPIRVRKKPVTVTAIKWTGDNWAAVEAFLESKPLVTAPENGAGAIVHIHTLEGVMKAEVGSWIIRGVEGEFYPCRPDIFTKTYEITQ